MTKNAWLLIILIYCFLLIGLVTINGKILLLVIPLLFYLAGGILYAPADLQIKATRKVSSDLIFQRKPASVMITVGNQGNSIDELLLEDTFAAPFTVSDGNPRQILNFMKDEQFNFEYSVQGERGRYISAGVQAIATDHFNLFQDQQMLPIPVKLTILPEAWRLRPVSIHPSNTRGFAGPIPARISGSGVDFLGVREYQIGDPLRKINWRVSTRHQQNLFTNEFEQERIADVGLILDARQQLNLRYGGKSLFEYSVMATAALADAFLKDGHRVALLVYGFGLDRVYPGYGKVQLRRILQALAVARVGFNYALESLNYLPTRLFPAHSQLVIVSPSQEGDLEAFTRLRSYGYEIMLVSPDSVEFEKRSYPTEVLRKSEVAFPLRFVRIERTLLLHQLRRVGVRVVDWQVDQPLDNAIHISLIKQPLGRRMMSL
jgi:uncharacterized protein (DUF58 family)